MEADINERQIEEIQNIIYKSHYIPRDFSKLIASKIYNKDYRKQKKGKWEWFEEWNPSTPEHPRECDECGWQCSECKTALEDVIGGYWDDPEEIPNLNFCPECGARMKGA
jgi:hypothetical protein